MKIAAWTVVVMGWVFYGLIILATILNPRPPTSPIEDIRNFGHDLVRHWELNIVMAFLVILYVVAWDYTRKDKEEK